MKEEKEETWKTEVHQKFMRRTRNVRSEFVKKWEIRLKHESASVHSKREWKVSVSSQVTSRRGGFLALVRESNELSDCLAASCRKNSCMNSGIGFSRVSSTKIACQLSRSFLAVCHWLNHLFFSLSWMFL